MKRSPMKRHSPKKREGHDKSMLEACRGEQCYLRVAGVCGNYGRETVPCHSNQARHGKGMGIKADDTYTVPGCAACHSFIDVSKSGKDLKFAIWDTAYFFWEPIRNEKLGKTQ